MKNLITLILVASLFITSQLFARTPFEEAVDTAIESKRAEQEGRWGDFPGPEQPQEKRDEFLRPIEEKIPIPTPHKEKEDSKSFNKPCSEQIILAANNENSCSEWSMQTNGCYERVCCCDKNGQMWCERCCPDSSGKCIAYKIRCQ